MTIRQPVERVGAAYAAAGAMMAFWSMMAATLDSGWCGWRECRAGWLVPPAEAVTLSWQPSVENPSAGTLTLPFDAPLCRGATREPAVLADAPLPAAFDPRAPAAVGLYACLRVGPTGSVREAYLVGGAIGAAERKRLLGEIRGWRFTVPGRNAAAPGWQRVRLFDRSRALLIPLVPSN